MFKRKCLNCGYIMGLFEWIITNMGRSAAIAEGAFDNFSNPEGITCPKCGETDLWIRVY